jgi:hypothetical protein
MGRLGLEVADIFRCYGEAFRQRHAASLVLRHGSASAAPPN